MAAVPGILRKWNPGILPGLSTWYDCSDTATVTLANGCNISQLNDKSGYSGQHLVQSIASNQPKYNTTINRLSTMYFTGPNVFLSTITANAPSRLTENSLSHFMIVNALSNPSFTPGSNNVNLYYFNNSNNTQYTGLSYNDISPTNLTCAFNIGADNNNFATVTSNSPYTLLSETYFNKGNTKLFIDTLTTAPAAEQSVGTLFSNMHMYRIGSIGNTARFTGNFGEIVSYSNYYYDLTESLLIEGYLAWKWGLVAQLSNGHPYKLRPPT